MCVHCVCVCTRACVHTCLQGHACVYVHTHVCACVWFPASGLGALSYSVRGSTARSPHSPVRTSIRAPAECASARAFLGAKLNRRIRKLGFCPNYHFRARIVLRDFL